MLTRIASTLFLLFALAAPLPARAASEAPAADARPVVVEKTAETEHGLMDFDMESAIWTLLIFLILLAVLYKTAWKQVLAGLKKREERIRSDIAQAEAVRLKSEATLKDYNAQLATAEGRARDILAKATADAQALAERIKADAEQAARDRAERAAKDIEDARDQALREIYAQTAELSTSIAEKILRRNLNPNDQGDLVMQGLEQMASANRG